MSTDSDDTSETPESDDTTDEAEQSATEGSDNDTEDSVSDAEEEDTPEANADAKDNVEGNEDDQDDNAETIAAQGDDEEIDDASGVVSLDVTDQSANMVSHLPLFDLYCSNLTTHVADALEDYIRYRPEVTAEVPIFKTFEPVGEQPGQPEFDRIYQALKPMGLVGVVVPQSLVYRLVDILFGGKGDSDGDGAEREQSPTEHNMIDVVATALTTGLQILLRNSMATDSVPELNLVSIQQVAKHVRSESMVCIPLSVGMDENTQTIEIWCSLTLLELVLGVDLLPRSDGKTVVPSWSASLKDQILDCPLDLKCTLAEFTMPLSRVSQMKKGDFIALSEIGEATFSMESLALFRARVGVVNDRASASFIEWL